MKRIILIIISCGLCLFLLKNAFSASNNIKITVNGKDVIVENEDNKFIAEIVSDYKEDLRIYGINDVNTDGWSPLAYAKYIFVAGPSTGNTESCEINGASNAPALNLIVENNDIQNKINRLKGMAHSRLRATIIGEKLYIKKFFYKNEDHSDVLQQQGKVDARTAIIVNDIIVL